MELANTRCPPRWVTPSVAPPTRARNCSLARSARSLAAGYGVALARALGDYPAAGRARAIGGQRASLDRRRRSLRRGSGRRRRHSRGRYRRRRGCGRRHRRLGNAIAGGPTGPRDAGDHHRNAEHSDNGKDTYASFASHREPPPQDVYRPYRSQATIRRALRQAFQGRYCRNLRDRGPLTPNTAKAPSGRLGGPLRRMRSGCLLLESQRG